MDERSNLHRVRPGRSVLFIPTVACATLLGLWTLGRAQRVSRQGESPPAGERGGTFQGSTAVAGRHAPPLTNSIGMKLVLVPSGEFMMGNGATVAEEIAQFERYGARLNADCFRMEYPSHNVRLTHAFYMGACHVTRANFARFVAETRYRTDAEKAEEPGANGVDAEKGTFFEFQKNRSWRNVGFQQGRDHPVVNVSWNDAEAFCDWLSKKESKRYRLPTEAEWEYACRAGTVARYWRGNDPEVLAAIANTGAAELRAKFSGGGAPVIAASDGFVFTSPVGKFPPNPFGLYDMLGNVWQWCADRFDATYYSRSPPENPTGPTRGSRRVVRGGAWNSSAVDCRCATRISLSPDCRNDFTGFRIVREP